MRQRKRSETQMKGDHLHKAFRRCFAFITEDDEPMCAFEGMLPFSFQEGEAMYRGVETIREGKLH